tara:strand:- start:1093 stop:3270 length:2178 start_codon:yes stop_codon:yes gene_type:complete
MNLVKESLAKLLAQEDLIVEHRQVSTAQFNVDTRVLTLPTWSHRVNAVTDLLIAHEVGHALYTPNEWDHINEVPQQFVNVTEDIRIEKLMKRRYQGLPKTFFAGYETLSEEDFFQIEGVEWSNLNLADKLNLYFKIGNFIDVPFTEEEISYRDEASKLETFDDALSLAKKIFSYCQSELDKKKEEQEEEAGVQQEMEFNKPEHPMFDNDERPDLGEDDTEYEDTSSDTTQGSEQGEPGEEPGGEQAGRGNGQVENGEAPTVRTADNLEQALKFLVDRSQGRENVYIELPDTIGKDVIVSNKEVSAELDAYYTAKENLGEIKDFADESDLHMARYWMKSLQNLDDDYQKFKVSNAKEVNYLVKEFECRKAASSYARAATNRTGVLDTTKLHTYRYNEDIFKKVTTIPNGKNHGLIFNVDWSGSMHTSILPTIKQLITLVSFCRKVGIAYDVYLFTDAYRAYSRDTYDLDQSAKNKVVCHEFNMVNILTSTVNNRKHERQIKNVFRLAYSLAYRSVGVPMSLGMGGTPLNEALISMNEIIPAFRQRTGAEKVHVISLTDGEGYPCGYGSEIDRYGDQGGQRVWRKNISGVTYLRDRKTGRTYKFDNEIDQTATYVEQLRDRFPECEFMNIYLLGSGEWSRFKRHCMGRDYSGWEEADKQWKKTKAFICTTSYWTVQYALHTGALDNDTEFEVEEDATKAQIKRAFSKSLGSKKMNKKILTSFIERIA